MVKVENVVIKYYGRDNVLLGYAVSLGETIKELDVISGKYNLAVGKIYRPISVSAWWNNELIISINEDVPKKDIQERLSSILDKELVEAINKRYVRLQILFSIDNDSVRKGVSETLIELGIKAKLNVIEL